MPRNSGSFFKVTVLIYSMSGNMAEVLLSLSSALTSPTHLCHSSFPFSYPCSSWTIFPSVSRDLRLSLKGKEQKMWKRGWEKLLHPHSWRRSCTGVTIWVRRWRVRRSVRTFGWNWHSALFIVNPSIFVAVFVTASLAFDPFPSLTHTQSWNQL